MALPNPLPRSLSLLALAVLCVACASSESLDSSESAEARRNWRPSMAGLGDWVWLRLDTDEWLKGEIIVMRNEELEFDSDNLGKLTIDWDDVVEVYSKRKTEILLESDERLSGAITVSDNVVTITDDTGERHVFPRRELRGLVPSAQKEVDHWSGKVSAGVGFRAGNSDQKDISLDLDIARRTIDTRYQLTVIGDYSETNQEVSVNSSRLNTNFDYYLNWQLFLTLASLEVYRDPIVNIAWQVTPGVGVGYTVVEDGIMSWEITSGVGYRYTDYVSVPLGEEDPSAWAALGFGTDFEFEITPDLDFELSYKFDFGVPQIERRQHHLRSRLSFDVTDDIDFDVTFTWDRNDPGIADKDGEKPEPNDIYVTLGLGIDF